MTHRKKEATHPLENYLPLTYGSNQPTLHGWISIPSSVHKWHKNSAVVYACCVFEILSCCVRVSVKVCSQYRVTEKLHVAFKLLDGISCPISLQALSRKCPLTYQPILSLQLFWQLYTQRITLCNINSVYKTGPMITSAVNFWFFSTNSCI